MEESTTGKNIARYILKVFYFIRIIFFILKSILQKKKLATLLKCLEEYENHQRAELYQSPKY